ncbi:MAG TPA: hypothetical protein VG755_08195 [Nannocystaceae bacterium]|nr:hypothetical protein [Nannocystaceae bacterium]
MRRVIVLCACVGCGEDTSSDGGEVTSLSTTTIATTQGETTGETSGATSSTSSTGAVDSSTASSDDGSAGPPTIARVGDTFVIPTLAATMPKRFADAAHDPVHDVYLVVNGNVATSGVFVDADGVALGEPFAIAEVAYTQGQRVAWGGDAFLAVWHDNRDDPNGARLRARSIAWDGAAPVLGADVEIGTGTSYSEMPAAIAWSETSQAFLVAWHAVPGDDIHAQRVAIDGTKIGDPIALTTDADWQSDAGLAWHPERDEFLAVWTHAGATTEVRARIVAADGSLPGAESSLTTAAGTWLAQAAFVPSSGDYLAAWFDGAMTIRRVAIDGTPAGDPIVLAPGYGSYDGFAIAYSPVVDGFAAVFHGTSDEDFAIAFAADGTQSEVLEATSSRGADGHFNPHVVASSTRAEWLLVTSLAFADIVGQRLAP